MLALITIVLQIGSVYGYDIPLIPKLGEIGPFAVIASSHGFHSDSTSYLHGDLAFIDGYGEIDASATVYGSKHNSSDVALDVLSDVAIARMHISKKSHHARPGPVISGTIETGVYSIPGDLSIDSPLLFESNGDPDAVWIFQVGGSMTVADNVVMTYNSPGPVQNVFWSVNIDVRIGQAVSLVGVVLGARKITVGSGSVTGPLMTVKGPVILNNNTVTAYQPRRESIPEVEATALFGASAAVTAATDADHIGSVKNESTRRRLSDSPIPSETPTSQPTGQPSSQPSSQPTQPTSLPTSQPSFNGKLSPVIHETYNMPHFLYSCHPAHVGSTPNEFMTIFHGLFISSTVYTEKARIWVTPYTPHTDQLTMNGNDYQRGLVGNVTQSGALEIRQTGGPELTNKDWNEVINLPAYKLNINTKRFGACDSYKEGGYQRTLHIQVTDRYGRKSNVISKPILIKTSAIMYTNVHPVKVTNDVPYVQYMLHQGATDGRVSNETKITGSAPAAGLKHSGFQESA